MIKFKNIPKDIINYILEYDGRIKYEKGFYINVISKNDFRYIIIEEIIYKKNKILKNLELYNDGFYLEFGFDNMKGCGLVYDCNFIHNKFEICYYDFRCGVIQFRTYL
jgi:hypothetical protein